uniref:Uncharacterized protein n=1 Tax=Arundo donax TaxID=35708 RepID=A0A0A8XWD1_ARUDO
MGKWCTSSKKFKKGIRGDSKKKES